MAAGASALSSDSESSETRNEMKTLYSKLPDEYTYDAIAEFLWEHSETECRVGRNTTARFMADPRYTDYPFIAVTYGLGDVALLYPHNDGVKVFAHRFDRVKVDRINRVLRPLGYKLKKIGRTWKVYSFKTGAYKDFFDAMVVEPYNRDHGVTW